MLHHAVPCGYWPANGARARHHQGSRLGAKGAGHMRTLRELEAEGGDLINDPLEGDGLGTELSSDQDE